MYKTIKKSLDFRNMNHEWNRKAISQGVLQMLYKG